MKHAITTIVCIFCILSSNAQTKEFIFGNDFSPVQNIEQAAYKKIINGNVNKKVQINTVKKEGDEWKSLKKEKIKRISADVYRIKYTGENIVPRTVYRKFNQTENGNYTFVDKKKEQIIQKGSASSIVPLFLSDTIWSYYENGALKSISVYDNNRMVSNKNWLRSGSIYIDNIHYYVDNTPEHEMGQINFRNYILNGLKEAEIDISQVADRVVIGWVVMEDGTCAGFHSTAGVYSNLKTTLIKLLKEMPGQWRPATLNGSPVRYYMSIPFNFIDQSENFDSLDMSTGFLVWD